MAEAVSKDDLQNYVGKETGVSDWFLVDQERVNQFADVTLDHQFIHIDPEKAAQTPFGTTIAHGFLTLSLIPHLAADATLNVEGTLMGINYGSDKVRFLAPVKVGSEIRARSKLLSVSEKPGNRLLLKSEVTMEIKDEKTPALIAETLTMLVVAG